jgi:3-polyprenyl-4-hydroxybenzoate decarboxylase
MILSAIAPLPENVPELLLASLLQNSKLRRCKLPAQPELTGIAEAEFCLSGFIPPGVRRPEGPFGDHYGYYSWVHDFPVFRPKAIYHREDAIFPCTVVGKPRQEDFYLGDYLTELLSPLFPVVMPAVRDLWSYGESGYHALASAVIKERYGRESLSSVFRILGEGQLALTKFLLAIDKPIPLREFSRVLAHVLERVDWRKDLLIFSETSMDTLDYAGPELNKGSKGVILGLGDPVRRLPVEWSGVVSDSRIRDVRVFCPGCLVVEVPGYKDSPNCAAQIAALPEFKDWPLIVAVDNAKRATRNEPSFIWTAFTRFNPQSDLHAARTSLGRNKVEYEGPVVLDARMKPWYPEELFCDEQTSLLVDRRWKEYFPTGEVAMGDSAEAHLASWGG